MTIYHTMPTRKSFQDLTGKVFGRYTVQSFAGQRNQKRSQWLCLCSCGTTKIVLGQSLICGHTESCGCYAREVSKKKRKHGFSGTPEYKTWIGIKSRTLNPKNTAYKNYGAKGITMSQEWFKSFEQFLKDMGSKPSKKHSIERIDNLGNYEANNCIWALPHIQARNRNITTLYEYKGFIGSATEWSAITGIKPDTFRGRIDCGWDIERIITTPKRASL